MDYNILLPTNQIFSKDGESRYFVALFHIDNYNVSIQNNINTKSYIICSKTSGKGHTVSKFEIIFLLTDDKITATHSKM